MDTLDFTGIPSPTAHSDFIDHQGLRHRVLAYYREAIPICLVGAAGIGKTTLVRSLPSAPGHLVTAVGSDMIPADLLGRWTLQHDTTVWMDGLLTTAVRNGHTFYLDEIGGLSLDCLRVLHPLLDSRREIYIPARAETVAAHPAFRLLASCNWAQTGIEPLPREFRDRFAYVQMERLDEDREAQLLVDRYRITSADAAYLIAFARVTRNIDRHNGASTRQLESAARAIQSGINRFHAALDCLMSPLVGSNHSQREFIQNAIRAEGLAYDTDWGRCEEPGAAQVVDMMDGAEAWS